MDSTHRHLNRGSSVSVSSDSHNTNNMEHNTLGYQLNEYDLRRIRPLLNEIRNQKIKFRYFLTIDYWYKMDNISKILEDNHHLKKTIRSFYKSDIKMFFFTERHLNPSAKNYGGFHRHILLEDAPESRWKNPTKQLQTWMNELTEKHISQYEEYFSEDAFLPLRMKLLTQEGGEGSSSFNSKWIYWIEDCSYLQRIWIAFILYEAESEQHSARIRD